MYSEKNLKQIHKRIRASVWCNDSYDIAFKRVLSDMGFGEYGQGTGESTEV